MWRETIDVVKHEQHRIALLEQACVCVDRLVAARDLIARDGITVLDGNSRPKVHPAVNIEKDARIGLARTLRELGLVELIDNAIRVPRLA